MKFLLTKFRVITIFVLALTYAFLRRTKKEITVNEKSRIVIAQMAKLGDMVCTTPMFRAVKNAYPGATLIVLGNAVNKEVMAGNPRISEYLVKPDGFLRTVALIRKKRPDILILTGPHFELLAAAIIAGVRQCIVPHVTDGKCPVETVPYRILARFVVVCPHGMYAYAPGEYLRLLTPLKIETQDTRKEVFFTHEDAIKSDEYLYNNIPRDSFTIGILSGAGNKIKEWKPERFARLISSIASAYPHVVFVLLGSKDDREKSGYIKTHSKGANIIDLTGALSLSLLKASIAKLTLLIGVDTGPQYIGEALNVPTIDIVGPVDENTQPPRGDHHRIVKVKRARAELFVMNAREYDRTEAKRQIDGITVAMVYRVFEDLYAQVVGK